MLNEDIFLIRVNEDIQALAESTDLLLLNCVFKDITQVQIKPLLR